MTYIVDIEADGLLEDMSKIHCLCWYCLENSTNGSITNYHEMSDFLSKEITIIGHNSI